MKWNSLLKNRTYLLFAGVLFVLLIIMIFMIVYIFSTNNPKITTNLPAITATPQNISPNPTSIAIQNGNSSPLQKAKIGFTPESYIEGLPELINKTTLQNGENEYNITSELNLRPNQIITQNGVVVFEKELTPESPQSDGYALITDYLSALGNPERIIRGSKFYGWSIQTYIYANKGIAFIGNPNTNEILEIHYFRPMSIDEYISNYGDDLDPNASPPQDSPEIP